MHALDFLTFTDLNAHLRSLMRNAKTASVERWQGIKANLDTRELRNVCYEINLNEIEDLDHWRQDCRPNLPWADDHFLERIGGEPLNPGEEWKNWPWGNSADKFRSADQRFNHSYSERMWPKYARRTAGGRLEGEVFGHLRKYPTDDPRPRWGLEQPVGDLQDLVELLAKEPHTRQAWIPLFYPEDTGISDGGRKMCSLGYQLMVRDNQLHMYYPLRSCDLIRHWRDDCYLAIRMMLWILHQCRDIGVDTWDRVKPGSLAMHMTSLHIFESDRSAL